MQTPAGSLLMVPEQPALDWAAIQQKSKDPLKVVSRILPLLLFHALWSSSLVMLRRATARPFSVSPIVHTLLGGTLGLLLAFRTNQAFERYWSACSAWAQLHRVSHNVARVASHFSLSDARTYTALLRHLISLPIAMKHRMRGQIVASDYVRVLLAAEQDLVLSSASPHLALLASVPMRSHRPPATRAQGRLLDRQTQSGSRGPGPGQTAKPA